MFKRDPRERKSEIFLISPSILLWSSGEQWRFLICFCLVCNQRYDLNHFSKWPELLSTFISQRYMLKKDLLYLFLFLQGIVGEDEVGVSFWSSVGTHPCNVRLKWSHECRGLTCFLVIDWRRKYSCIVPNPAFPVHSCHGNAVISLTGPLLSPSVDFCPCQMHIYMF